MEPMPSSLQDYLSLISMVTLKPELASANSLYQYFEWLVSEASNWEGWVKPNI